MALGLGVGLGVGVGLGLGVGLGAGVGEGLAGLLVVVDGLLAVFGVVVDALVFAAEGLVGSVVAAGVVSAFSSGLVSLADFTSPVPLGLATETVSTCASLVSAAVTPITTIDVRIAAVMINVKALCDLARLMTLDGIVRINKDLLKIISRTLSGVIDLYINIKYTISQ